MSELIKKMVIDELRAENEKLRQGVDFYEEVLHLRGEVERLRNASWANANMIDKLEAENDRLRAALGEK